MSDPSTPRPSYAPPAGYVAPTGFPAPYATPGVPSPAASPFAAPAPPRSSMLGVVALLASVAATVLSPIIATVAAVGIGAGLGRQNLSLDEWTGGDLSVLSPVRDWVLLGEVAFWAGTLLGVWALVQGIVAITRRAGRVQGIIAVVLAAIGPVVFAIAVQVSLTLGYGL
ncbi:hypothetical protein [Microbacterium sp. SLBN-146]|uniref:hypothetical protein n=1 Tax=Microbacterium sp. SLBN-146 TaxID=2768457 RepID=UPI00114DAB60|nr:hypothetical protein [Microbacterium sp. SLBN-146]TQJ31652.1 hypothetical protein FBY39_2132 [Microbacterium sp. SLBN-146]